jgi:hypothetical protein
MNLQGIFRPPGNVWIEMKGLEPGESVRFIIHVTLIGDKTATLERLSEEAVGDEGLGLYREEIELNIPIADIRGGDIQVIHAKGITCAEIEPPVIVQAGGESIVLLSGENVSPANYVLAQNPEFNAGVEWVFINGLWEPLASGVEVPIDICQVEPDRYPDCITFGDVERLREPTPTAMPGSPEGLQTFTDPLGRFAFDYPAGWHAIPVTPDPADGIQVMNAPSLDQSTQWISFNVFLNEDARSLPVWMAEHGKVWAGQVTATDEDIIMGVPVLRQRLENDSPATGDPYVYSLVWVPYGEHVLLWTAWPGDRPETLNLLERMVTGFRAWPGE